MRLILLIIPTILQTCVHEELRVGFEYVKLVEIEFPIVYRGKKNLAISAFFIAEI